MAMFELTIEMKLSYQQVMHFFTALIVLFFI